ncbi:MAG: magnesium/cobalt transporter CorA [Planctomycetota bacterium]|nr:magnesium/cobalt transporter CorA [Planctomycetota bacterium]
MIRTRSLREGTIETHEGSAGLRKALASPEPDWVTVVAPDREEIDELCDALSLHPLAVRDALKDNQPPKLHEFGDHLFFIVHTPVKQAWSETRRIAVFLSPTWIVTIQATESQVMDKIAERVEQAPEHLLSSPDALAHEVIDQMMVGFEDLTAEILDDMTKLEDLVLSDASPKSMQAILKMRRRVIGLGRVTRSQRDVCASLCRLTHPALSDEVMPYLRDVYDHILRVFELIESAREGLAVTRDAHLAIVNNRLSEIMRTLTIIATVMMPLSLIAGIYGMNFEILPGQKSPAGFWITIGVMLGIAGAMLVYFRRRRWF